MVILVISGKQGSGKSTLANNVAELFRGRGKEVFKLRFAQPLYEMHDAVRGILKNYQYGDYDYTIKDGNLLQLLGTEWGRKMNSNIWVQLLLNSLRALPKDALVKIEDCRFENEFDAFESVPHVYFVRLEASRQTRKQRATMWRDNENHASETGLDHYAATGRFDYTFDTNQYTSLEVVSTIAERLTVKLQKAKNTHE